MLYIVKAFFFIMRELLFDSKEEYDMKSTLFNTRKFVFLIIVTVSIFMNFLFTFRIFDLNHRYRRCVQDMVISATLSANDYQLNDEVEQNPTAAGKVTKPALTPPKSNGKKPTTDPLDDGIIP